MRLGQALAVGALRLVEVGHRVEAETVEAEVEPEAHDVQHGVLDLGVVVVEVRLLMVEAVPVVLAPLRVEGPVGRLDVAEDDPDVGEAGVVVRPHVPVGLVVVARRPRLDEPGMLVARVVHHEVGDDPDPAAMGLFDDRGEVVDVAELGGDGQEVADVITAVVQAARGRTAAARRSRRRATAGSRACPAAP